FTSLRHRVLTTALVVLRTGWVIVGSLPTSDRTIGTVGAGCLIVLDPNGNPVETFSGGVVNGPWDMTASDGGFLTQIFFTNVLNGGVASAPADTPRTTRSATLRPTPGTASMRSTSPRTIAAANSSGDMTDNTARASLGPTCCTRVSRSKACFSAPVAKP